jgi:hypothetical protein
MTLLRCNSLLHVLVTRQSSGKYHFEEMTTLHGLIRQYYYAVNACGRI